MIMRMCYVLQVASCKELVHTRLGAMLLALVFIHAFLRWWWDDAADDDDDDDDGADDIAMMLQ
jgi:hypothetical protein